MKNQAKTPAWSPELHILPCLIEEEIDRGDMREVVEIGGSFWKVVQKWGFLTGEDKM